VPFWRTNEEVQSMPRYHAIDAPFDLPRALEVSLDSDWLRGRHRGHWIIAPHQCLPTRRHAGRHSRSAKGDKDDLDIQAKNNAIRISSKKKSPTRKASACIGVSVDGNL
jgi:hypothetical protein